MCEHCGYRGNCAETHALFAILDGDRVHAMKLIATWHDFEKRLTQNALTDYLSMVTA